MIRDLFEDERRDVELAPGAMLLVGGHRINMTFRKAA